mgnify:CR=1 FL=1
MLDVGANPEATPAQMVHNAVLGSIYAQSALGIVSPRIGLLSVGTEEGKGGARINRTHSLLKAMGDRINYVGPVEGFDVFGDACDVVVTDGFTGNVALKTLEGGLKFLVGAVVTALPPEVSWDPPAPGAFTRQLRFGEWIHEPVTPLFESWLLTTMEERSGLMRRAAAILRERAARYGELIEVRADARSVLHNPVRSRVGSLRLVGEGKWTLTAFVNNVEDTDVLQRAGTRPILDFPVATLRPPRTSGVRVGFNF